MRAWKGDGDGNGDGNRRWRWKMEIYYSRLEDSQKSQNRWKLAEVVEGEREGEIPYLLMCRTHKHREIDLWQVSNGVIRLRYSTRSNKLQLPSSKMIAVEHFLSFDHLLRCRSFLPNATACQTNKTPSRVSHHTWSTVRCSPSSCPRSSLGSQ